MKIIEFLFAISSHFLKFWQAGVWSFPKTKISFDTFSLYHRWIGGKSDFDIHSAFCIGHVDNKFNDFTNSISKEESS